MDLSNQRSKLISAKKLIQSVKKANQLSVSDLYIPPRSEILERSISKYLKQSKKDAISSDPILDDLFRERFTFLESYKNRESRDKVWSDEKNVFAPQSYPQEVVNPLQSDTMLLKVCIFHPVTDKKTQEWLIPSSSSMQEIFKNLECLAELIPFNQNDTCFLFIDEKVTDLSRPIDSLNIQIGSDYYLTHRESCVHRFQVSEGYLVTENDIQEKSLYPLRTFKSKTQKRKCEICTVFYAKFICLDAPMIPKRVCYMCNSCLEGLFPSKDFNIYPYYYD